MGNVALLLWDGEFSSNRLETLVNVHEESENNPLPTMTKPDCSGALFSANYSCPNLSSSLGSFKCERHALFLKKKI